MIHPHKWLFILVLIVLFSSGFARAQQILPKPDKEEIAAVRGRLSSCSVCRRSAQHFAVARKPRA